MRTLNLIRTPFFLSLFELFFGKQDVIPGSILGNILVGINGFILTYIGLIYFYQIIMSFYSAFTKAKKYPETDVYASYIFVTSARNEELVVGQLIESIRALDYPQDKIEIHVIADNCEDKTKEIAERYGVRVIERYNKEKRGKSFALAHYFETVKKDKHPNDFAGYIIVDTDNVFDKNYLKEINKVYQATTGDVIAAYRASTNVGESLWAFGSGYSFLRECALLHKGREKLGLSSYVSGTSFFVSKKKMDEQGGWIHHRLIEDIEFSTNHIVGGGRIYYAHDAIFYDEQTNHFRDSWRQRMRWTKGLYQMFDGYGLSFTKSVFTGKKTLKERFSTFESALFVVPYPGFLLYWFIIYGVLAGVNLIYTKNVDYFIQTYMFTLFDFFMGLYLFGFSMSLLISISNWKRINMSGFKKVVLPFFMFFFLLTYMPMLFIAPFVNITWKPVKHYGIKKSS